MMQPMKDCMLKVVFVRYSARITPNPASGTENMTTSGSRSDSNWHAMTM